MLFQIWRGKLRLPMNESIPHPQPAFEHLAPEVILNAVEESFDLSLTGILTPYSSYINRVYGVETDDGERFVVKFYRPNRWSEEAILEEHRFVLDCVAEELPVVAPEPASSGSTLQSAAVATEGGERRFLFALYRSKGGRLFDAEGEENWLRIGALIGRVHVAGRLGEAKHRLVCMPDEATRGFIDEVRSAGVVHPDIGSEFFDVSEGILNHITPDFKETRLQRIHGDCHRGNILDRQTEGLMMIDFDDMVVGPPVQDIWLLLPDYADSSYVELELILEGYERFGAFDRETIRLIEPLRFMRMVHFIAWSARQRNDHRFREAFPDWGEKSFWIKEIEDLRVQAQIIGL